MSAVLTDAFRSGLLDEMCCGTVELSVPLRRDVIQVGVGGDAEVGRIRVTRWPHAVTVARVDGKPIQVDLQDGDPQRGDADDGPHVTRVFDVLVPELRLHRTDDGWTPVGSSVGAAHPDALKRFADVIGVFAVAKQERARHSHRLHHSHRARHSHLDQHSHRG